MTTSARTTTGVDVPELSLEQWPAFFAAVHGGKRPFRWQTRLVEMLLADGVWPEQIGAPTGAGKTAVIDVHVFAVAMTALDPRVWPRLPRRLALVVDRRALVDDQYDHARRLAALLAAPDRAAAGDGMSGEMVVALGAVAGRLGRLRWPAAPADGTGVTSPLVTARLRGAVPPPWAWRDDPAAAAVLCATPDMWGSRLLLRGYGSTAAARPRETGLLARDAVVVVDEAHLARQLLTTARRVADLQERTEPDLGVPPLQVVATTATPDPHGGPAVAVEADDLTVDVPLRDRLTTAKPVTLLTLPAWPSSKPGKQRTAAIDQIVAKVRALREEFGPTVGCFLNTVRAAVAIGEALEQAGLTVELLVGRMRPHDVDALRQRRPGLRDVSEGLGPEGLGVDVLVCTQTLEVGVDVDLSAAVTELAPGTALAQRAGRVNRLGTRATTQVAVATGGDLPDKDERLGPYLVSDLADALRWVRRRAVADEGLAPWALRSASEGGDLPPAQTRRRDLFHRVEPADTWHWARTSDELAADPELALWLADDLAEQLDVGIVVRRDLPDDPTDLDRLLRDLPPRPHEVFPTPLPTARDVLDRLLAARSRPTRLPDNRQEDGDGSDRPGLAPVALLRGTVVDVLDVGQDLRGQLRPGDLIVVDDRTRIFRCGVVTAEGTDTAADVLEAIPTRPVARSSAARGGRGSRSRLRAVDSGTAPQGRAVRIEPDDWPENDRDQVRKILAMVAEGNLARPSRDDRDSLADALTALPARTSQGPQTLRWAAERLRERIRDTDVILHRGAAAPPHRLIIVDVRRLRQDEDIRQTWTGAADPVPLDQHAAAVADRAATLAENVGLPQPLVQVLRLAGQHHDDGKADLRFQARLRGGEPADPAAPLLAKSGIASPSQDRARNSDGLPARWRHEQLSVLHAWHALTHADDLTPAQRHLIARLVGTSHGHGRHGFPHTATEFLIAADSPAPEEERRLAVDLFDHGGWDELIEDTTRTWGVWGCAYLEAVLRAADGQISMEGS